MSEVFVDQAANLVHGFLDRILRVTSGFLGVTLDLLRGSLSFQPVGTNGGADSPLGLADRLIGDASRSSAVLPMIVTP
jgi:hypothetical protein